MTANELRAELVAQARRLVDQRIVDAGAVSINEWRGTVRNRITGELLHYDWGGEPPSVARYPWPRRI